MLTVAEYQAVAELAKTLSNAYGLSMDDAEEWAVWLAMMHLLGEPD